MRGHDTPDKEQAMNIRHLITAAGFVAAASASFAQTAPMPAPTPAPVVAPERGTNTPLIDKHEANQEDRIKQGRQSGELTKHEAHRLKSEQHAIDRKQTKAAADGTVTAEERQKIRKMQDHASKDVYRQKHDDKAAKEPAAK
jgi:Skp family chaperone for outer membrane proteins